MLEFDSEIANQIVTSRGDVEDIDPVKYAFMSKFTGTNARWMGISRQERSNWVAVYINRQSRALDWFPVSDPGHYFDGVDIGYRYVKGHTGKGNNPGMDSSIAERRTLKPGENHVLLLRCANRAGFEDLVRWYAGEGVLGVGEPPSPTEVSGEGSYVSLERSATTPIREAGAAGDVSAYEPVGARDIVVTGRAELELPDDVPDGARSGFAEDGIDADSDHDAGSGWMADPECRKAVEMHAVGMAVARYVALGFLVEERGRPFDLLCTPTDTCVAGMPTVHVEVKGSLGSAMAVHLTRNEVADARGDGTWRSDLYIVGGITVNQDESGAWVAAGGTPRWIEDWYPHDDHLTATDYAYVVPR